MTPATMPSLAPSAPHHEAPDAALLALDLRRRSDPDLVTEVLARCVRDPEGGRPGADRLWDMEVGERLLALVRVAEGLGIPGFEVSFTCPRPGCGAAIAIELTPGELAELAAARGDDLVRVELPDGVLALRRPTGRDQLAWGTRAYPSRREAVSAMVAALRVDGPERPLTEAELDRVEASLDAEDPLVRCAVDVRCPACDGVTTREVDLVTLLLGLLSARQAALLDAVHRLALAYHWSEAEILALPPWRRARYLGLLEAGGS